LRLGWRDNLTVLRLRAGSKEYGQEITLQRTYSSQFNIEEETQMKSQLRSEEETHMHTLSCRAYLLILVALCFLLFGGSSAHAADGEWTTVAAACVPDEDSVGLYQFEQARFEFSGASTGQIVARCNITDPADLLGDNPSWGLMDVTYNDPDGFFNSSRVRVQLRRVHETTGASTTIATFDSNLFGIGQQLKTLNFNHAFNFVDYAYYLTIILDRTDATVGTTRIERVRLYTPPVG
jgi:hypothetical protein